MAASAGKPLWITELDIEIEDRDARADAYDDVTTLYFSDPNIDGILLWGFSDQHHWRPNAALFEGDDFVVNNLNASNSFRCASTCTCSSYNYIENLTLNGVLMIFSHLLFQPNAAGRRWQEMMIERWRTEAVFSPSSSSESFGTRGFYGGYNLQVRDHHPPPLTHVI